MVKDVFLKEFEEWKTFEFIYQSGKMINKEIHEKLTNKTHKIWRKSIHDENDEQKVFRFDIQGF